MLLIVQIYNRLSSLKVEYIDDGAFRGCENLVSVTMPEKQIEYGYNDAFSYCPKLTLKERKKIKDTGYSGGF